MGTSGQTWTQTRRRNVEPLKRESSNEFTQDLTAPAKENGDAPRSWMARVRIWLRIALLTRYELQEGVPIPLNDQPYAGECRC